MAKIFLLTDCIFKVRIKRNIWIWFLGVSVYLIGVSLFASNAWIIPNTFLVVFTVIIGLKEKKQWGKVILFYVLVSIVDIINAFIIAVILRKKESVFADEGWALAINCISLLFIVGILLYTRFTKKDIRNIEVSKKHLPIYIIGLLAVSLYLTSLLVVLTGYEVILAQRYMIITLFISSFVIFIVLGLLVISANRNERLKYEIDLNHIQIESQKDYYTMLLKKDNETKAFRHDIRNHIYCMKTLIDGSKYAELKNYIENLEDVTGGLSVTHQTGDELIDAMIADIGNRFSDIKAEWKGILPRNIRLSDTDKCAIFYNLILNAFEAAQKTAEKRVSVTVKKMDDKVMISILNSMTGELTVEKGETVSSKTEAGHGYGLKIAYKCIEKNGGIQDIQIKEGYYRCRIILPLNVCLY